MADDDGAEKSEDPTSKKLSDARKKGNVPQSQELSAFITLTVAASFLMMIGPYIGGGIADIMKEQFSTERQNFFEAEYMLIALKKVLYDGFVLVAPVYAIMMVAALIGPYYMNGFMFSPQTMKPKFSKLNPIKGLKKVFGPQGLVLLGKSLLKVAVIGTLVVLIIKGWLPELLLLGQLPLPAALAIVRNDIFTFFLILSSSLIVIAMLDVPYQKWHTKKQLKMTKQEVKDESKQSDGAPEIKQRIRQAQFDASQRRMMDSVPDADVVITNPTHFAVALQYDDSTDGAPIVVAKGADLIAAQIRSRALGAEVPLVQVPPLARALFNSTEVGQVIPSGLYLAVAKVLAYVFQLRQSSMLGGSKPILPTDLPIPDEYKS
jgi:flagellar biosynthesis protein FlhB